MRRLSRHEVTSRKSVYVVSAGRRHVKIGIAANVHKRIQGIQTGCPFKVKLVRSWVSPYARAIEIAAHRTLEKYRWQGEWFDIPMLVAVQVVGKLVVAHPRREHAPRPDPSAVVFCANCRHFRDLPFMPETSAKFRCSRCNTNERVHVVEVW